MSHPDLQQLLEAINNKSSFAIFGHQDIDGDCIGSCLAFGKILEKLGKKVEYFTTIQPSKSYNFIPGIEKISTSFGYKNYDSLVFLDFTPYQRIQIFTKGHEEYFDQSFKIIIDHHIDEKLWGQVNIIDITASSNCENLAEIIWEQRPDLMDSEIATWLYLGLMTDTGNMLYEKESIRTTGIALKLLQAGADKKFLVENIYYNNSLQSVKFLGTLIERLSQQGPIVYTYYTDDETRGIDRETIDHLASQFQAIKEAKIFLLLRKVGDKIKGSLRSKGADAYNVQEIAKELFNGGGHKKAAGFAVPFGNKLEEEITGIVEKINKKIG